ncbi:MAG: 30S ribosomal protein S12 methylthiotransferase RimO [Clostridiales bacterium]|nr:30S ribosomal protein S12 methylthiotransferase RimO [Clostridiales bacterium]
MKIAIVSLGCNKNLVDSEVMAGYLKKGGYNLIDEPQKADVIIVNTCGFIEDAKVEAVDTIFQMAQFKDKKLKALLVSGCLTQRYPEAILEMPEVDGILGTYAYKDIDKAIKEALKKNKPSLVYGDPKYLDEPVKRQISTKHYAYLKIAEGCDNKCAYCAIPSIRGPYVSRDADSLLNEAEYLKSQGIKEIILTAQDTTRYGLDKGKNQFKYILEKIALMGFEWVRIMYAYPSTLDEDVIKVMEKYENICKYIDMPIQHTQDKMLKLMNRHYSKADLIQIIKRIRSSEYDWALRTTLMCGFPGETHKDFKGMLNFISEYNFDNLGVFPFSLEEGTEAENMPHKCRRSTCQVRADSVMLKQGEIAHKFNKRRVGKQYKTLVEGFDEEQNMYFGRTEFLAPEVDGKVYFSGKNIKVGDFIQVYIEEAFGYDLFGRVL